MMLTDVIFEVDQANRHIQTKNYQTSAVKLIRSRLETRSKQPIRCEDHNFGNQREMLLVKYTQTPKKIRNGRKIDSLMRLMQ